MGIIKKFTQRRLVNARKPTGKLGRSLIRAMNIRHYPITNWGLSHVLIGRQDIILDIGCGGGGTVYELAKTALNGKVYGIDFSDESVKVSWIKNKRFIQAGRVGIQQGSVSYLPFSGSIFDLITAVNTHNYWSNLVTDLQEVFRVLKPDGKLIIIGSMYEGGKHDKRNQKYAELIEIAFPSINELCELFLKVGYSKVQTFEKYNQGWMCVVGRKPL
jgi:ubiquinone/menaquinone biosynthesis C-methylase UbiE